MIHLPVANGESAWLRRILLPLFITIFILSAMASSSLGAVPQPASEFYVLDQARVLKAETSAMIIQTNQQLERKTGAQVAVVTLNSLDGEPLEDVSLEILRSWGLGEQQLDNGVLILVVPSERKSRIEVGFGLEGALPDAKTGRIQDQYMIPAFEEGDYDLGISQGYRSIIREIEQEYQVEVGIGEVENTDTTGRSLPSWADLLIIIGIIILMWFDRRFFNGFFSGFLLAMLFRGRGGGGGSGGGFGGGGFGGGGGSSRRW